MFAVFIAITGEAACLAPAKVVRAIAAGQPGRFGQGRARQWRLYRLARTGHGWRDAARADTVDQLRDALTETQQQRFTCVRVR